MNFIIKKDLYDILSNPKKDLQQKVTFCNCAFFIYVNQIEHTKPLLKMCIS